MPYVPHRSEEHTSELQSLRHLVCRLLLEKTIPCHLPATHVRTRSAVYTPQAPCPIPYEPIVIRRCYPTWKRSRPLPCSRCAFFLKTRAPPDTSPLPSPAALQL